MTARSTATKTIHLVEGAHFSVPGIARKAFASKASAVAEAVDLANVMLRDEARMEGGDFVPAMKRTWRRRIEALARRRDADCYVDILEFDLAA